MSSLRARTIRLAHENPDLQPLLLPLLTEDERLKVAVHNNNKGRTGPPLGTPTQTAKKPVNGTAIRSGYYESGDKIGALESAVKSDPATRGDKALIKAVADLQKAHDAVAAALKPYNWD